MITPAAFSFTMSKNPYAGARILESVSNAFEDVGYERVLTENEMTLLKSGLINSYLGGSWSKFAVFNEVVLKHKNGMTTITLNSIRMMIIICVIGTGYGLAFYWNVPVLQRLSYGFLTGFSAYIALFAVSSVRVYLWLRKLLSREADFVE